MFEFGGCSGHVTKGLYLKSQGTNFSNSCMDQLLKRLLESIKMLRLIGNFTVMDKLTDVFYPVINRFFKKIQRLQWM